MVDIDIKGYNDLWDPSLEDSIALTANYRVINGITNLVLGQDFNDQDTDDIAKTGEKLLELAPNVRLIQDDNTQDSLLNGEASVAFLVHFTGNSRPSGKSGPQSRISGRRSWIWCNGNVHSEPGTGQG